VKIQDHTFWLSICKFVLSISNFKYYAVLILLILFSNFCLVAQEDIVGGILNEKINSDQEDYGAYLILGEETDTLFFTSSRPVKNRREIAVSAEMFYSTRPASQRSTKPINQGWSKAKQIIAKDSKIAEITRGSIAFDETGNKIIFAAERDLTNSNARGSSYLFDLYEMVRELSGFSEPQPLDDVNEADYWDSQPALSADGKMLYFVS